MPSKITLEQFIINANLTHNNFYDYSKADYIGTHKKVTIICPLHGEFQQTPANHCFGQRCPSCGSIVKSEKKTKKQSIFLEECKNIHGDKYDYSKMIYTGIFDKITLICKDHGEFQMIAHDHQTGRGCNKCGIISRSKKQKYNKETFIHLSKKRHGLFYDYSKVEYTGAFNKVEIICPIHGSFMQQASIHYGKSGCGCPECGTGESYKLQDIDSILGTSKKEATFDGCKDKNKLRFDRYIKSKNILVEFDGEQHFRISGGWNTIDSFYDLKIRDEIKTNFAIKEGFNFIRIKYNEDHIKALTMFLHLVENNPGKQIIQIYGTVAIKDKS